MKNANLKFNLSSYFSGLNQTCQLMEHRIKHTGIEFGFGLHCWDTSLQVGPGDLIFQNYSLSPNLRDHFPWRKELLQRVDSIVLYQWGLNLPLAPLLLQEFHNQDLAIQRYHPLPVVMWDYLANPTAVPVRGSSQMSKSGLFTLGKPHKKTKGVLLPHELSYTDCLKKSPEAPFTKLLAAHLSCPQGTFPFFLNNQDR